MDEYVRPHRDRAALLTIDTQNDFTLPGAPAEIDGTAEVIPRMRELVEVFRATERPIVHVVRLYRSDGSNVDRCRRGVIEAGAEIVRPRTAGAELVADLKPSDDVSLDADRLLDGAFQAVGPREWIMYKPRWGAFHRTKLDAFLADHSVDTVVVCGCNFPNCPRATLYEASEHDYRLVFVANATSGVYDRGRRELEDIGVAVWETADTIAWLSG